MRDPTELVASGRTETLIQVCLTAMPILCPHSPWHGLATGQKALTGGLKLSVINARVNSKGKELLVQQGRSEDNHSGCGFQMF